MSSPTLRPATCDDIDAVIAFWQTAGENDDRPVDRPEAVERLIARDPEALVLAVEGTSIIGSLIIGWDGWRCHLYRLAVAPTHRRQGIARQLLAVAEESFAAHGGTRADAMVRADNVDAHRLWQAAGYAPQASWQRWVKPL